MFPWADGKSLRDFWNERPKQAPNAKLILQVIQQLRALADVLDHLHNIDHHQSISQEDEEEMPTVTLRGEEDNEVNDYRHPIMGGSLRHGDLKPENILRFLDQNEGLGYLKIADMGLAKRHVLATQDRDQKTSMTYGTRRYEAPEAAIENEKYARSRLYDIWSMGCITFEFIIWTLYGNEWLTTFHSQVARETHQEWQFYELVADGETQQADINKAVKRWMSHLEKHEPECQTETKSALGDLLGIVREKLLVVQLPPNRLTAISGGRTLQPPALGESKTRYRATAAEFRAALDRILQNAERSGYIFTGKERNRISMPSTKTGSLRPPQLRVGGAKELAVTLPPSGPLLSGVLGRPIGADYALPPLEDWTFDVDNGFAERVFAKIGTQSFPLAATKSQSLCNQCSNLDFWSAGFFLIFAVSDLQERAKSCDLCRMLQNAYDATPGVKGDTVRFERNQSVITMTGHRFPIISIFRSPSKYKLHAILSIEADAMFCTGLNPPLAIQLGLPELPKPKSDAFFTIIKLWLEDCDANHPKCIGSVRCELPTRLIEVGTYEKPLLRLVETRGAQMVNKRYVALSHPWGDSTIYTPFSTLRNDPKHGRDIRSFKKSIPYDQLPATFRDAVDCTRQIGIPYLWIDSLCIIQGPGGDFADEAKRMEDVYSGADCVFAASRAIDQRTGFLSPRLQSDYVTFVNQDGKAFYVCKTIDNFNKDVIDGTLNRRGWVLQERALARRTIYFTENQTYFECGKGVRCETLTKMQKYKLLRTTVTASIMLTSAPATWPTSLATPASQKKQCVRSRGL